MELPESPFRQATDGWPLGSQAFVDAMRERMKRPHWEDDVPMARRLSNVGTASERSRNPAVCAVASFKRKMPVLFVSKASCRVLYGFPTAGTGGLDSSNRLAYATSTRIALGIPSAKVELSWHRIRG